MYKYKFLFIILVVNLFIHFGIKDTLLSEPPIWPDEAFYVNIVKNVSQTREMKSTIYGPNFYQIDKKVLGYPPLYFYLIYIWVKLFGFSPVAVRLFSTTSNFIVIILISIIYFKLNLGQNKQKIYQNLLFSILPIILLCFDFTFLRSSRILRPEITVLSFVLLALYSYINFLNELTKKRQYLFIILAGLFSGIAGMIHFIGFVFALPIIIHIIFNFKSSIKLKSLCLILFVCSLLLYFLYWSTLHITDFNIFWVQLTSGINIKKSQETFYLTVFYHQDIKLKILYALYTLVSFNFLFIAIKRKHQVTTLIAYYVIIAGITVIVGKMFWYYVFPIPFIYLSLGLLMTKKQLRYKAFVSLVVLLFGITNISILWFGVPLFHYPGLSYMRNSNYSYEKYIQSIQSKIPDGATVFISSIPDPYLGLHTKYNWYEFPPTSITTQAYLDMLNNSDFVVFNGIYESRERDNLLIKYLDYNTDIVYKIIKPYQYGTDIIKLKPKNQRIWQ